MKKTLITLLALGGLAMGSETALTFNSATITKGNTSVAIDSNNGSFTVAMTMDKDKLFSYLGEGEPKSWADGVEYIVKMTDGSSTGVYINGSSNSNNEMTKTYLYASWNNAVHKVDNVAQTWSTQDFTELAWDSIESIGFAYTHHAESGASWTSLAITMLGADGTVIFEDYKKIAKLGMSGAAGGTLSFSDSVATTYYITGSCDENTARGYAKLAAQTPAIPEPTTATLSLLALAGLCARRRRK